MIRVGMCGCGALGSVHAATLHGLADVEIRAVCDLRIESLRAASETIQAPGQEAFGAGAFDLRVPKAYDDLSAMLEAEELDLVVVATPTDLHAEHAAAALAAGCHVFCEKPMAMSVAECDRMIAARDAAGRQLMIGQCIRFWPEYEYLAACIADGRHGTLVALEMNRVGYYAQHGSWFSDHRRSGGAQLDLHVHDVDWAQATLGSPDRIAAAGRIGKTGGLDDITALWEYDGGPVVTLRGSWFYAGPFQMSYRAIFDEASLDYALGSGLRLSRVGAAEPEVVSVESDSGHAREIRYFVDCLKQGRPNARCTAESSCESVRLAIEERDMACAALRPAGEPAWK